MSLAWYLILAGVVVRALRARGWVSPVGAAAPGIPKEPERGTSGVRPMV